MVSNVRYFKYLSLLTDNVSKEFKEYWFTTITFGTTSAPHCAIRAMILVLDPAGFMLSKWHSIHNLFLEMEMITADDVGGEVDRLNRHHNTGFKMATKDRWAGVS